MIAEDIESIRPKTMDGLMPSSIFADAYRTGANWVPVTYTYYFAIARFFQPRSIMEIGVLGGCSMAAMLLGVGPKCRAVGWDIEAYRPQSNELAMETLHACGVHADLFKINSQERDDLGGDFDLVHVDGEHGLNGALHDLKLAVKAKAAVILFDDIFNQSTQCREAADRFTADYAKHIAWHQTLPTQTGLAIFVMAPNSRP